MSLKKFTFKIHPQKLQHIDIMISFTIELY